MANSLADPRVQETLKRLHAAAKRDIYKLGPVILYKLYSMWKGKELFDVMPIEATRTIYLPVSKMAGERLYQIALSCNAKVIVEFGCSYGVSTIYLAAAARDNGGRVITTELDPEKCEIAQQNLEKAGLAQYVEIRVGDARKTLVGINDKVNMLFLDGWKQLYYPLLGIMLPKLSENAALVADDVEFHGAEAFNNAISSSDSGFLTTERKCSKHGSTFTVSYYKPTVDFIQRNNLTPAPLPKLSSAYTSKNVLLILSVAAIAGAFAANQWRTGNHDNESGGSLSSMKLLLTILSIAAMAGILTVNECFTKKADKQTGNLSSARTRNSSHIIAGPSNFI
ncbi:MAG: uncharacterized protein K0Q57_726 [Gammaproteobacteria bacterium]|nr:uncharacterized protein [Gammaproteobacteria bacterium]